MHSSMYRNLRTNLPREVMSYTDFPFTRTWQDSRRFCSHQEVRLLSPRTCRDLLEKLVMQCSVLNCGNGAHVPSGNE